MNLFPYRYKRVADKLYVFVSKHFFYSDFGVRGDGNQRFLGGRYICVGTPGTGFIERASESRSYHAFVRGHKAVRPPSYLDFLFGKEPDYNKELHRANELMHTVSDPYKRELTECYINALTIGRMEEELQRTIAGVKRKMKNHHGHNLSSIVSHYKRKIVQLNHDMESVEYHVKNHHSAETYEAYSKMVQSFGRMVDRCRRIWHHNDNVRDNFVQVFFDLGIFDFIRNEDYLPMMRDSYGVCYFLLPDAVIVARSSVDFDLVPLKTLTIVYQETAIEETTDLLSSRIGDAACMLLIPELNLTFYFNHAHVVVDFVHAVDELKKTL